MGLQKERMQTGTKLWRQLRSASIATAEQGHASIHPVSKAMAALLHSPYSLT